MQRSPASRASTHTPSPAKSSRSSEVATYTGSCLQDSCSQQRLASFDYCSRHILQDHSAPFKQCAYVYNSTGKRCLGTAPKTDKRDGYCAEHSRKSLAMRLRASRQKAPVETADTLLQSLNHYVPQQAGKSINPFEDIDAARLNGGVSRVLDLASDTDSEPCEGGAVTLDAAWSGDSETEGDSPDSDMEDPLRHAGVYTDEEVVAQARDRLKRLQSLYLREFRSLQFKLREQRRFYLASLKKEKETLMSIHQQPKKTAEDIAAYRKLQALNHYRRPQGVEAVLHKKAKDRKAQAMLVTPSNRQGHASRCSFTEGGVKCDDKALPLTKLCLRHILNDSQQLLFRACGVNRAELPPCQEPVLAVFTDASCLCHRAFPQHKLPPQQGAAEVEALKSVAEVNPLVSNMKQEVQEMALDPETCPTLLAAEVAATLVQEASVSGEKPSELSDILPQDVSMEDSDVATPDFALERRRKQDLSQNTSQGSDTDSAVASASESDVAPL